MKYKEFVKQDKYCKSDDMLAGKGCPECPAEDKNMCANRLRRLCERLIKSAIGSIVWKETVEKIKKFGLSDFNILQLYKGIIEFSEQ